MAEQLYTHEFSNGLTLVAQPMEAVSSAAFTLSVPCGNAFDPAAMAGTGAIGSEWMMRGAGDRDSRALNDALDALGSQHHEGIHSEYMSFSSAQLGRNLDEVLAIFADVLRRPCLSEQQFESCRQLITQDLIAMEDEPGRKVMAELRERFYPSPLGRLAYGSQETLAACTPETVRGHLQKQMTPDGAILGVAGAFEWQNLKQTVERLLGDWTGEPASSLELTPPIGGAHHEPKDSAQTYIALAHKAIPCSDDLFYPARLAVAVLSQGMGSRLFTEVREKRGLCYHVSASYASYREHAGIITFAGTRPELAQQTMDVTVEQLRGLSKGIFTEELIRAKTQIRSALIMQGQSTSARATAIRNDWYHRARVRSLEEINDAFNAVTEDDILDYLRAYPADDFTVLVLGPDMLTVPNA